MPIMLATYSTNKISIV